MDSEITGDSSLSQPKVPQPQNTSRKIVKMLLFIVFTLLIITVSVFIGMQIGKKQILVSNNLINKPSNQNVPTLTYTPSIKPTEIEPTTPPDNTNEWQAYTYATNKEDELSRKGFILYYPPNWTLSENRNDNPPSLNVKLTKNNGDYFEIIQGAGGGGYCLFPDQPEYNTFEGMATKYSKFIEIKKNDTIVWRLADWPTPSDLWSHQLCQNFTSTMFKNGFKDSTTIGFTKIKVTTPESLQELKEILEKIQILNK